MIEISKQKCFQIICYTISFGLCLYQILTISGYYFEYKTQTSVKYDKMTDISIPSMTICFDKYDVLRDKSQDQSKDTKEFLMKFGNRPIREQFDLMYDFDDIFNFVSLNKNSLSSSLADFIQTLKGDFLEIADVMKSLDFYK